MLIPSIFRPWLLGMMMILSIVSVFFLTKLKFDFNVENLFPRQDDDLVFYQDHIDQFRSDKTYMIVGIEAESGVFNADFLFRLDRFIKEIDSSQSILSASSITNIKYYLIDPFFKTTERRFLHPLDTTSYEQDSLFLSKYPDVKEKFISALGTGIAVYLELPPALGTKEGRNILTYIEHCLINYGFENYHLSGSLETESVYVETLKSELTLLLSLSLVLILIVVFLTFRSFWGTVIPFVIISLTVLWTLGSMAAFGVSINVITVLIPSIIAIVALSDVIHIMTRYQDEITKTSQRRKAIKLAVKDIGIAIFLTSITTAFGFITLSFSDILPFIEFGLFTALGVLYAWFLAIFLLPIILIRVPISMKKKTLPTFSEWPQKLFYVVKGNQVVITVISILMAITALFGMSRLKVDSLLYEELSAGDRYSSSLHFFDQHFSGIRPVEIYIEPLADSSIFSVGTLAKIDSLDLYLTQTYGVNGIYSVNTQIKRIHRAMRRGRPEAFRLPDNPASLRKIIQLIDNQYQDLQLSSILTPDYGATMIAAKISDLGSYEIRQKNKALQSFLDRTFPADQYLTRITGKSLLLDKSNEVITYSLGWGLLIALVVVAIMMGILFESPRMALIALLPNVFPLLLVAGIMGLFGVGLKMSTAVIFTVAFGIAVDDTIHFLSRFRSEWKKGKSLEEALSTTYYSTGRAILITSLILVLGFGLLMFSSFQTNFITGFFVSLSLLMAVFADLFLLPVLLFWLEKKHKIIRLK